MSDDALIVQLHHLRKSAAAVADQKAALLAENAQLRVEINELRAEVQRLTRAER